MSQFSDVSCNDFTSTSALKPMPSGYGGFTWSGVDIGSIQNAHSAIVQSNIEGVISLTNPGHPINKFNISSFNAGCLGGNPPKPINCNILIRGKDITGSYVATQTFQYTAAGNTGTSGSPGTVFHFDPSFANMVYMDALPYTSGGSAGNTYWGYCTNIKASIDTS